MTYAQGAEVLAADFNFFQSEVASIFNVGGSPNATYGYGQATTIPTVSVGDVIRSHEWTLLRDAVVECAQHQGSTVSMPTDATLAVGQFILAFPPYSLNLPGSIATIIANRLTAAPSSLSLFANQLTSSRTASWNTQVVHDFTVTFSDSNHARYFFNSGGSINMRASLAEATGSHQNNFWVKILNRIGSVSFAVNSTYNSYKSAAIGAYQMTSSFQLIFTENSSTTYGFEYGGDNISIYARANTASQYEFQIQFNDSHTGFSDVVSGTLSSNIDMTKATNPLTITSPTFATVTPLTSGS